MAGNRHNRPRARTKPSREALAAAKRAAAQLTAERQAERLRKAGTVPMPIISADQAKPLRDRKPPKPITDELIEKLVKRDYHRQESALAAFERQKFEKRWSHKQGTPETHESIDSVPQRRRQSPLARMFVLGKIDADDLAAAQEIAAVVEMLERDVSVRGMSFDDRVDNSGSGRNALTEGLRRIRAEVAYDEWRSRIPAPKRMVIDTIVSDVSYVEQARRYDMRWGTARKRLISALRMWQECSARATKAIDREDVNRVYERLGERK